MGEKSNGKTTEIVPERNYRRLGAPGRPGRDQRLSDSSEPRIVWADIPAGDIQSFLMDVTGVGGAVICGTTSDGGALSVTVLLGEYRIREWPASAIAFQLVARLFREKYVLGDGNAA